MFSGGRYDPQELILANTAQRWSRERGSRGQRVLTQNVKTNQTNPATTPGSDHKRTPSILAEQEERELVHQVQQAVDVVLGSAAKQMGVDKSALAKVLWKNGLVRQPFSTPSPDQWDLRR